MARTKLVHDTREIPHLWFHQAQPEARNRQGNLFYEGDTIYSYGRHFPIARIVRNKKGQLAVLFTSRGYSNTTSKHISYVRRSIPDGTLIINVYNPSFSDERIISELLKEIDKACDLVRTSRNRPQREKRYSFLKSDIENAKKFADFTGEKIKLPAIDTESMEKYVASYTKLLEKREASIAREAKRRTQKLLKERAEYEPAWRAGTSNELPYAGLSPVLLRIVGDEVQTSLGAIFPVRHAKLAMAYVQRLLANGETFVRNGKQIRLGHYQIDKIDADGTIYAGCHIVTKEEVERLIVALEQLPASRECECLTCGHKFTQFVELSAHTNNLSGEKTIYCPSCSSRAVMASAIEEEVEETVAS